MMEAEGLVSSGSGGKAREVLVQQGLFRRGRRAGPLAVYGQQDRVYGFIPRRAWRRRVRVKGGRMRTLNGTGRLIAVLALVACTAAPPLAAAGPKTRYERVLAQASALKLSRRPSPLSQIRQGGCGLRDRRASASDQRLRRQRAAAGRGAVARRASHLRFVGRSRIRVAHAGVADLRISAQLAREQGARAPEAREARHRTPRLDAGRVRAHPGVTGRLSSPDIPRALPPHEAPHHRRLPRPRAGSTAPSATTPRLRPLRAASVDADVEAVTRTTVGDVVRSRWSSIAKSSITRSGSKGRRGSTSI